MEILDEQAPVKRPYNSRALKLAVFIYCGLVTLGYVLLYKRELEGYDRLAELLGSSLFFWLLGGLFYLVWRWLKWNVIAGVVIYILLNTLVVLAQIANPVP